MGAAPTLDCSPDRQSGIDAVRTHPRKISRGILPLDDRAEAQMGFEPMSPQCVISLEKMVGVTRLARAEVAHYAPNVARSCLRYTLR